MYIYMDWCNIFTFKNTLIFFIIIIIIYQSMQINNIKNSKQENFTSDELSSVRNEINKIYNMDVEAIRNLGTISKSLLTGTNYHSTEVGTPGDLTIPADNTIFKGDMKINGGITVDGPINFSNKDTLLMDILPRGIILSFNSIVPPMGWTLCNGLNGAPDLQGRFILGSGSGSGLTNREIHNVDGVETHTLTVAQMPSHTHEIRSSKYPNGILYHNYRDRIAGGNDNLATGNYGSVMNTGSGQPHNNMPPFYVLTYIMKL
jgi:microcystin-dependent protein